MARHLRTYSVPLDHRKLLVWTECRPERAPQGPEETQAAKHFIIRKKQQETAFLFLRVIRHILFIHLSVPPPCLNVFLLFSQELII